MILLESIEKIIGHTFKDKSLLKTALTHSSFTNEHKSGGSECNERLEFLGDSILGMLVAYHLYQNYTDMPEGKMTKLRADLVCEQSLVPVAQKLELGKYLLLGKGEDAGGGRERPSILADAVEALLAAAFLDGGMAAARKFVSMFILSAIDDESAVKSRDYKTALQELVQRESGQVLSYSLIGEKGPDHDKTFTSQVSLNDKPIGRGMGRTKKEAEQEAARRALEVMER